MILNIIFIIGKNSLSELAQLKDEELNLITSISRIFFRNCDKGLEKAWIIFLTDKEYKLYQALPPDMKKCLDCHFTINLENKLWIRWTIS